MSAPTANTDKHTVTTPLPFDALAPLLIHIATEMWHGDMAVALDELATAQARVEQCDDGFAYDLACSFLDLTLQDVEALLPGVTWELPAADAANLGFGMVDAAEDAGIAGWCAHCSRAVPLGSGIPYDGTDLIFCGSEHMAEAAEHQAAAS